MVAGQVQSFETGAFAHKKLLKIALLASELFIFALCLHDDRSIVPTYALGPFGKSPSDQLAKSVFCFGESPFGHRKAPSEWLDYLAQ